MRLKLFLFFIFLNLIGFSQAINDEPCFAIPLPVTNACNQTTSSNYGATASAGIPAPVCGTYSGGDVWFSATVPASGSFTLTTYGTALNNIAVATYTGVTCSSLTLISCTYNGVGAANMPVINITGTPGVIYYFRAWNPSNNTLGYFDICATSPSPTPLIPNNQDCLDAIPICQSSFTTTTSYTATGNVGNEINSTTSCLGSGEKNDVWYQFTVQNSGNLCFAIDPINNSDDYDWTLINMTSASCSDIYNNHALEVACNYISQVGGAWPAGTGPAWVLSNNFNSATTGSFPAPYTGGSYPQNHTCPAVTAGESFVLNISNFSSSQSGYNLYFPPPGTAGMAIIFDNVPPVMQSLAVTPGCGANQMFVNFSENIQCGSIQNADFAVSGPGGPYTISDIVSTYCSAGGTYDKQLLINFTPALTTPGTYTVCLTNAAGSVLDACNNPAAPTCYTFSISGPSISVTPTNPNCNPNTGTVV
ncbi:MAG TPA: Ig-like domain-containing protein, partial [Bacteroidia bacterium]|nr:Ig-like domain-containing protein [Bacteroidia bacterium]